MVGLSLGGLPCGDQFGAAGADRLCIIAGAIERTAYANALAAARQPIADGVRARAADGPYADITRQHILDRLDIGSPQSSRREQLDPPRACADRGKGYAR